MAEMDEHVLQHHTADPTADIDVGHTAFLLVCMALVQLMTPGLAFFYGGLCKNRSVGTMMAQNFASMGIVTVLWFVVGFSLCFGHSASVVGMPQSFFFFQGLDAGPMTHPALEGHGTYTKDAVFVEGIPGIVFAGYQGMFAVITPALMTGCFAERMRFGPYLAFITIWLLLVYCPFCHWVWGPDGWMAGYGAKDFAGGIVVHITSGFSALASILVLGKRVDFGEGSDDPHNVPFVALGTALLWFGWFGFNAGSALAANGTAAYAAINSEIAASVAMTVWMAVDWYRFGQPKLVGMCVGAIAGLATVTPAAGFILPWGAFIIGVLAALVCYGCCELKKRMNWDDTLDVWGVHGCGGFLGTVMLGALADESVNPANPAQRSGKLFAIQLGSACFTAVYSMIVTAVILFTISKLTRLKPTKDEVEIGLDMAIHGEMAYNSEMVQEWSPSAMPRTPGSSVVGALRTPSKQQEEKMGEEYTYRPSAASTELPVESVAETVVRM
jgi:Amt family ammonium transporter